MINEENDISRIKFSDFLTLKENQGKIREKRKKESEKKLEFDGDLKKESQKFIKYNKISEK